VESCYTDTSRYDECDSLLELEATGSQPSVPLTDDVEKQRDAVSITATADTYAVVGYSASDNSFAITK
jgi:hypothetical protein